MTGYDYSAGMSNRAVDAYRTGKAPLSQITLPDLRAAGWTGTKKLAIHLAKTGVWRRDEWHHSGGTWYNRVDFYCPSTLVELWNSASDAERETWAAPKTERPVEVKRVRGHYAIFGGSRRRPQFLGNQEFTGTLSGNWILLDDGGKKKANGNHITWEFER